MIIKRRYNKQIILTIMFDQQKARELEARSHNRGVLSKEFYHSEQNQLERKRQEWKKILDEQVNERKKQKQRQKIEQQQKIHREEQEIKSYYKNLEQREKKDNLQNSGIKQNGVAPYQTFPIQNQIESRYKQSNKKRSNSKAFMVNEGDIPVMPQYDNQVSTGVFTNINPLLNDKNSQGSLNVLLNSKNNNIGNIPLLDLSDEPNNQQKSKKNKPKNTTKRQKSIQSGKDIGIHEKGQQSRQFNNHLLVREDRKSTNFQEQESVLSQKNQSNERRQTQIQEQIYQFQQQNKNLKLELKKSQQAISLLIGAVRSNVKLDKYRVQAQKILYGPASLQESIVNKKKNQLEGQKKEENNQLQLPKIYMKHQSIMHDYLISAAQRNSKKNHK